MRKETITYTDYNGVERTEDFYFNYNKAELMEKEIGTIGGYSEVVKKIIAANDMPTLIKIFKELVLDAYGEKSADGKRFIKRKELSEAFSQTEAYSILFTELAMDSKKASDFVNGLIPSEMAKELNKKSKVSLPAN